MNLRATEERVLILFEIDLKGILLYVLNLDFIKIIMMILLVRWTKCRIHTLIKISISLTNTPYRYVTWILLLVRWHIPLLLQQLFDLSLESAFRLIFLWFKILNLFAEISVPCLHFLDHRFFLVQPDLILLTLFLHHLIFSSHDTQSCKQWLDFNLLLLKFTFKDFHLVSCGIKLLDLSFL